MSDHEVFRRHAGNPILTAADWSQPVNAVFNPAAATVDGETVVLARVEDRRGISHLGVARSADGLSGWSVDPEPFLAAADGVESEQWGFEDPRAVWVRELERWVITCTAYGPSGPAVYLATTTDFRTVERVGIICQPEEAFPVRSDPQSAIRCGREASDVSLGQAVLWREGTKAAKLEALEPTAARADPDITLAVLENRADAIVREAISCRPDSAFAGGRNPEETISHRADP